MNNKYAVEITEPLNPLKCANLMHPYMKKGEPLTPDFCRLLLQSGNNKKIMRDMLSLIDARLQKNPKEYTSYREILYGVFCEREQAEEILNKTANITKKYLKLENADKLDRRMVLELSKRELSADEKAQTMDLSEKICARVPVDIEDMAENMVEQILENKGQNSNIADQLSGYAISEIPEKTNRNIFVRLFSKMRSR